MTVRDLIGTIAQAILLLALLFAGIWLMAALDVTVNGAMKEAGDSVGNMIEFRQTLRDREREIPTNTKR